MQTFLKEHLFAGDRFKAIVGEEDESNVNLSSRPYTVDDLQIPDTFCEEIDAIAQRLAKFNAELDAEAYRSLTCFIDPIDGTREFSTGVGEQCTICVGFTQHGRPLAGLVFRPIPEPCEYAAGAAVEQFYKAALREQKDTEVRPKGAPPRLLTSNGGISPWIGRLLDELGGGRIRAGGCGNKVLMLLERRGDCYIQDRGLSRWDTCAAEAILAAAGGVLAKLEPLGERYTYKAGPKNRDFIPGMARLTRYNAARGVPPGLLPEPPLHVELFRPYSNLCGLFAVADMSIVGTLIGAVMNATKHQRPALD